jgi:enoyl-CoA hydratase
LAAETLIVETVGRVALVTLNRPEALNALNALLARELTEALAAFDADPAIGAIVLTGSEKAFAAGADVKEMAGRTYPEVMLEDFIAVWDGVVRVKKPIIAAVSGFALGGGCELAMMCDIIIAADNARFGQPEIRLGIIPGIGGTQRLVRAVGKAKAMDLILTGRMIEATEAERCGLVARVVAPADLRAEALELARTIADMPSAAVLVAKAAVSSAFETMLTQGVLAERQAFYALFATPDQKEGMAAFIDKRLPSFRRP